MPRRVRQFRAPVFCGLIVALGCGHKPADAPVQRPKGKLDLAAARHYVVELVNHDRARHGLDPVELDDVASVAGQDHTEDMVRHGYKGHWGTDGSVPEERYTRAGGTDVDQENAFCFFDGETRAIDSGATFDPALLETVEAAFIDEKPPNDGHRLNILKPRHNRVGIGIVKAAGVEQPCLSQEFVDDYGNYDALPRRAKVGQNVRIAGSVNEPAQFAGIGLSRIEAAHPLSARQINETTIYKMPGVYVLYSPKGYVTPKPVNVSGKSFEIEVPISDHGRKGRYGVSIWARFPETGDEAVPISLRIIEVR